jgi:hypothetical protein
MALRMILNKRKGVSTKDDCKKYILLRLPEIHTHAIAMFMYKYKNKLLPELFDDFFKCNNDTHQHNTRNANTLRTPLARTNLASKFIKQTGMAVWNHLEDNFDVNIKIWTFKKKAKKTSCYKLLNYILFLP